LADFPAPALLSMLAVTHFPDEMLQRAEEKGSESSFLAIGAQVGAIADELREKSLGQILRIFSPDSFPAQGEIKWSPVNSPQLGEAIETMAGRKSRSTRRDHNRPAGRNESSFRRRLAMQDGGHLVFLFDVSEFLRS